MTVRKAQRHGEPYRIMKKIRKILLLGSGALKIGQAGEFDYSGSQAIKAFKEEGKTVILINPNIATYQTTHKLADKVYFLPIKDHFVEEIIKKEKVDAIALSFGGQTGLNCALSLEKKGVFKKYNVEVLGTSVRSIQISEDRKLFSQHLHQIKIPTPKSIAATSLTSAEIAVKQIGFPVMIRAGFALGGQKSGVAHDSKQFTHMVKEALAFSPQVLIEKYLHHFKEIEYEIVRDRFDNCIAVCNMENMDPLGIHTGDSIVVAPSQTLTNFEYHHLREVAIKIVRSLDIVGECNVQFALSPKGRSPSGRNPQQEIEYYVIELNPRLSRSSALASKATGYPLAYIAAKLILGTSLIEIENQVTRITKAFFEPALDYIVVKLPRWDLEKFKGVENKLGSSMKSVGEVMAIGRKFEEALQKAVRMLDLGRDGVTNYRAPTTEKELLHHLTTPTTRRLFALVEAFKKGFSVRRVNSLTGIDPWFLFRVQNIVNAEKKLKRRPMTINHKQRLRELKEIGFSDRRIGKVTRTTEDRIRSMRKKMGIIPSIFQIDTLAGEVPAKTNYLYLTYNGSHNDVEPIAKKGVIVLGSGPYRIGSSVEFDWTCVNTALALKKYGKKSVIINCNPETVSTDYDMSDRLYFEELTYERVADINEFEGSQGVIASVGGQAPHNIVQKLSGHKIRILGTQPKQIDQVEDRTKFSALCDELGIQQPAWRKVNTIRDATAFANKVRYPVLIRPSYVLSGAAMSGCNSEEELEIYIKKATILNDEHPITISKFFTNAKEIELDGVAQNGKILISAMSEHVEDAGVHSGDATIIYPAQRVYLLTEKKIIDAAEKLVKKLNITGPFNMQFLGISSNVFIIEMNARASRTFPFISRATGHNLASIIVDSYYGKGKEIKVEQQNHVLIKAAQFSFSKLNGADPVLHVEMSSTGEAAAFGDDVYEAFYKAILSVGEQVPRIGVFLTVFGIENKMSIFTTASRLNQMRIPIYTTANTHKFLKDGGIRTNLIHKIYENRTPNILTLFEEKKVDLVINVTDVNIKKNLDDHTIMRRAAIDFNVHIMTNLRKAQLFIKSAHSKSLEDLHIKSYDEYIKI